VTRFIEELRSVGVELVCQTLGVAVSTHYDRLKRKPSAREQRDALLTDQIRDARSGFRRAYGSRKTWKQLRRNGIDDVGRDRVARVMRANGWEGVSRGRKPRTTVPGDAPSERPEDLLDRDFTASRPNEKWVADFTYVRTWQGFVYMAFILDVYSRYIVGWQIASHMRTGLVLDALEMAHGVRQPPAGVIAHNDRGTQYTSYTMGRTLRNAGVLASMGRVRTCYDNVVAESFFATLKTDRTRTRSWPTRDLLRREAFEYIERWYNPHRRHSTLGGISPAEWERRNTQSQIA
jgi:putative transposase